MKPYLFLLLALGSITAPGSAAPQAPSKVVLAQDLNASEIAQVKAGTLKTANASWWDFNKDDATECLQNAIDSGVARLIVDNTGSDWIVNKPISLVSNQEIHFADGVVIQARKGDFKGKEDSLFSCDTLTSFALIGEGKVVFRMHREDYANPALYDKAEWRHGISLQDCSNVVLRNITVTETGGDGLYLGATPNGTNKNVLVENMVFDANYRQGISVISADGLIVRNSKAINTDGTDPQAGIDFEPNFPGQQLSNCLLENNVFADNTGGGIYTALEQFDGTTKPISITVKQCIIRGNSSWAGFAGNPSKRTATNAIKGDVVFEDCTFDHNPIRLIDPIVDSIHYLFKDCTLDFTKTKDTKRSDSPIVIVTENPPGGRPFGNITFNNVTVINDGSDPVSLAYNDKVKATVANSITGPVYVKHGETAREYDLAGFIKSKQDEFQKINQMVPATIDLDKLHAPISGAARMGNDKFYVRSNFTFLQYAKKGEVIAIDVIVQKVSDKKTTVDLIAPSGKSIQSYTIPLDNKPFPIMFTAGETGLYSVVRTQNVSQYLDITSANPGNGLLADEPIEFLPRSGKLYFQVPAGVKDFTIGVSTGSTADVALVNPSGKVVKRKDNVNSMHLFSATRNDASKSEIWSIDVSKSEWLVTVAMYAPLVPVVSTNPKTLLLK